MSQPVKVTAAIIRKKGLILIAQRKHSSWLESDKWEFPGGKIEPGETPEECLVREIQEELGIRIALDQVFMVHPYTYMKEGRPSPIELHVFLAQWVSGEPQCLDCQDFRWVRPSELRSYPFVAGDLAVVEAFLRQQSV